MILELFVVIVALEKISLGLVELHQMFISNADLATATVVRNMLYSMFLLKCFTLFLIMLKFPLGYFIIPGQFISLSEINVLLYS